MIITYEQAQRICKYYDNFNFSEKFHRIGPYKISTFDYFICGPHHFENPLPKEKDIKAYDMRGITFVFDENGNLWNKFLMLPKFFNLNETESTQYSNIKDKKILNVSNKEDGSLIAFMMLPNGKLFAKTIAGFSNDQSEAAMQLLYKWEDHVIWVKDILKNGYTPLFEYVSRDNRIVLKYSTPEIKFIALRDNQDGSYHPAASISIIPKGMSYVESFNFTLEELIAKSKTEENIEGWVVQFEDGQLIKIKTEWYFDRHGLRTENVFRPDYIINNYLSEKLDDIVSQLSPEEDSDAIEFINVVKKAVNNYNDYIDNNVKELTNVYTNKYQSNWNKFAADNNKKPFFGLTRNYIDRPEEYTLYKKNFIIKINSKLQSAKKFVEKWAK